MRHRIVTAGSRITDLLMPNMNGADLVQALRDSISTAKPALVWPLCECELRSESRGCARRLRMSLTKPVRFDECWQHRTDTMRMTPSRWCLRSACETSVAKRLLADGNEEMDERTLIVNDRAIWQRGDVQAGLGNYVKRRPSIRCTARRILAELGPHVSISYPGNTGGVVESVSTVG